MPKNKKIKKTNTSIRQQLYTCIGTATDEEGASVGVDGRKARNVLPHILKVLKGRRLFLHDSCHAAQSAALELLTPV